MARSVQTRIGLAAVACLAATGALAVGRPSAGDMTCRAARGVVTAGGSVIIGTGGATYDRFVRDRSFCEPTEITSNAFVRTRDNPQCMIGYRCLEPSPDSFGEDS